VTVAPLGFPKCPSCPYVRTGTPQICAACAASTTEQVPSDHCPTCSQAVPAGHSCRNLICSWPLRARHFSQVDAVAMYSGDLASRLKAYKYEARAGWGMVFGRLIVGWLERAQPQVDLIVGNPTAETRQPYQHIERILQAAQVEDVARRWPIVPWDKPLLVKREETPKSAGNGWQAKMAAAEAHASAIQVIAPEQLPGARVLLVDDLFTTGAQFVTVSRILREAGAIDVRGLVIARTPWGMP
jgi:predicted amidophosphoribosyltransferase